MIDFLQELWQTVSIVVLAAGVLHLNKRVCELELRDKNRQARGCDGNWMT